MPRKFRLRIRPGSALHSVGDVAYGPGEELVVTEREAAQLLREKGRRSFEIAEVFDDEAPSGEANGSRSGESLRQPRHVGRSA
jgi:hypothetical protein